MKIIKSSRHSKITGDFGEGFILYLLSKTGFECASVDHTGIDIIARRPNSKELMGISVKSRSRSEGSEGTHVNVTKNHIEKIQEACKTFKCKPYIAFVVDEANFIKILIVSIQDMLKIRPGGNKVSAWAMTNDQLQKYKDNKNIMWLELSLHEGRWWQFKKLKTS
jgi:Holliday junction resolvase